MVKENFQSNSRITLEALTGYLEECEKEQIPVIHQRPISEIIEELSLKHFVKNGGMTEDNLKNFLKTYLNNTTRLHHKHYMAHQVSVPHTLGALGSFIDGVTNNAMAIYEMGPSATAIEFFMINWMLEKIGWTPSPMPGDDNTDPALAYSGGVMTHGGSLANLTALTAARSAMFPEIWRDGNPGNIVVLVPEQSHYSLKRTVGIIGLGENNCISMPADEDGRVLPSEIPGLIDRLENDEKKVMAVVGNACGTAAGLYDPLEEIGAICNERKIWFHVDAAHGAGAIVCDEYRHLVRGIRSADSVIWDAHKMFRTPVLCAAVLVKDHRHIEHAFSQEASYLVHDKEQPGIDMMMRAVECTKSGLGLKMFMSLAAMGEKGLCDYIGSRNRLAIDAANYIQELDGFECPVIPETCILCFRIGSDNGRQLEIRKKLLQNGHYYISTTLYKNARWLRCVLINPDTTLEDLKGLFDEVRKINSDLDQN